jgi:chemotaxis protein CheY-P-specific phosphatase CheC
MINPSEKTFSEMSLKELREAQNQAMEWMKGLRAQMEEKMKTMPPESREAMQKKLQSLPEGVFGEDKPAKVTVKATGKQETVNGFACKEYEVYEDGELATRYWLAPSVSTKAFDAYQKELSEWLGGMGPLGANRLKEWEHVRDKGFPIKVTRVKPIAGQFSMNREILRIEEKSLDEALFQPPKEYKRVEAPQIPKFGGSPASKPPPK